MAVAEGYGGPRVVSSGAPTTERFDYTGAQVVTDAHGRYWEAARLGRLFTAQTSSAGIANGTTITTTAPIAVYNPVNSGVLLSVLEGSMGYVSGTVGALINYWAGGANGHVVPGGTALSPFSGLVGAANSGARALAFTSATGLVGSVAHKIHSVWGAVTAMPTTAVTPQIKDALDGMLVVPPGCFVSMQQVGAAGTSPLIVFSITWEEIPLV